MRYPANRKLETRARIVRAASRGFRERGLAGLGVATVMAELGLTHGGFYAHFAGKDALVIAACQRALADAWKGIDRAGALDPRLLVRTMARSYLSMAHRDERGRGCPIAALGPELARSSPAVRHAVAHDILDRLIHLSARMPGRTARRRQDAATLLVASLVGTLLLARLLPEREGRRSLVVTRRLITQIAAGGETASPPPARGNRVAPPSTPGARHSRRPPAKDSRGGRLAS